jgi:cytoskeleton protein RodZ
VETARLAKIAARAEAPKAERPKVVTDASVLKFRFKGESWVEIRDSKGRILLSRLNAPGSEAEVAGKPPFNVVVGNAPEVRLFYNDQEFDLEPHTRVAVARFTVE